MRIDLHYGPQAASESRSSAQNSASLGKTETRALPGEDQAVLSGGHVQVAALAAQASQLPEVREERVQSLRLAVATGEYTPDPQNIAGAMMAHLEIRPVA